MKNSTIQAVKIADIAEMTGRSVSSARTYVNGLGVATRNSGTVLPVERIPKLLAKKIEVMPTDAETQMREKLIECIPEQSYWLQVEVQKLKSELEKAYKDERQARALSLETANLNEIIIKENKQLKNKTTLLEASYKKLETTKRQLETKNEQQKISPLDKTGAAITTFTQSLAFNYLVLFLVMTAVSIAHASVYVKLFDSSLFHAVPLAVTIQLIVFLAATSKDIVEKKNWYDKTSISEAGTWVLGGYYFVMDLAVTFSIPTENIWYGILKVVVSLFIAFCIMYLGNQNILKQKS